MIVLKYFTNYDVIPFYLRSDLLCSFSLLFLTPYTVNIRCKYSSDVCRAVRDTLTYKVKET